MNAKKRNLLIGGVATVLMGLFALTFLIKDEVPVAALKPVPIVEEVHMPPPAPAATAEQIAAADAAAAAQLATATAVESAAAQKTAATAAAKRKSADKVKAELKKPVAAKPIVKSDAELKANADKAAKARLDADARLAAKRSNEKKPLERKPEPLAAEAALGDSAKPKEARFNMTQGGKKMTPEDFDAWMKSQGIRIVPAKPAVAPVTPAVEPVKTEGDGKEG